ncbi:MAG: GNAT family N-acetyltransferase [Anaerolineae bacterium]|nr:GNAT family N-acetyltransferase [Anaerolineae bacterium]
MTFYKKLVGQKCYLSPCSVDDAVRWTQWDNNLEVSIPLGDEAYTPYSLAKMQDILNDIAKNQSHIFGIVDLETDELIGRCMLFNVNHVDRNAMLGIVIGEKTYWGQGYGQDAIRLLLDYGFNLLNLNSVMLGAFEFNVRAMHCYQKIGFKEIGRRRQARIIAGHKYDVVLMDILAEEFESAYVKQFLPEPKMQSNDL